MLCCHALHMAPGCPLPSGPRPCPDQAQFTEMETNRSGVALLLSLATVSPGFTRAHVATPKGNAIFTLCFLELRGPNSSFLSCFEVHTPLALPTGSYFLPQDLLLVYRAQVMGRF